MNRDGKLPLQAPRGSRLGPRSKVRRPRQEVFAKTPRVPRASDSVLLRCFLQYGANGCNLGKRRPGRQRLDYLGYIRNLLGDTEGDLRPEDITNLAADRRSWGRLVVDCSAARQC
ncbi:uncharacterized protein LOC144914980 isoform X2 [Branchiostoma floridae x Branchiostoma belcheri]